MDCSGQLLFISESDRATLERWVRMPTSAQRVVRRSRIVLLLDEGLTAREVARRVGVSRQTVDLWRRRYVEEGRDALTRDRPGRGRKPRRPTTRVQALRGIESGDICP